MTTNVMNLPEPPIAVQQWLLHETRNAAASIMGACELLRRGGKLDLNFVAMAHDRMHEHLLAVELLCTRVARSEDGRPVDRLFDDCVINRSDKNATTK